MIYKFEIEEKLCREFYAIADSEEEAKELIYEKYANYEINLTSDDYVESKIYSKGLLKDKDEIEEIEEFMKESEDE